MIYLTTTALILYLSGILINKEITEVGQSLLLIIGLKCIYDSYKSKELKLPKSALWLIMFLATASLSIFINSENIIRPSKYLYALRAPTFGILGIYIMRYWIKKSSYQIKRVTINIVLASLIISCSFGLYKYFTLDEARLSGFIHIMKQGYGLSLILSLLIPAIIHSDQIKNFFSTKFAITAAFIMLITLVLTLTRGAVLGLICSFPFIMYRYKKKWGHYCAIAIFAGVTALGSYYFFGDQNTGIRFITTKENESDNQRRSIWLASLYAFREKPFLGWGYLNLEEPMADLKIKYDLPRKDIQGKHSHNNFIEIAAGTGIVGLFFFLAWLITWYSELIHGPKFNLIFAQPFLVNFLISGQFEITIDHRLAIIIFFFYSSTGQSFMPLAAARSSG